ncbi:MAG TPA: enoyl-CoA hydratase/isomerase family protein [Xanthobacteraceae bacterium]|nr:enoyl-CoA hydratase/isomerase family protein [Xanthobacteraceae bacterium]
MSPTVDLGAPASPEVLRAAGFDGSAIAEWLVAQPAASAGLDLDRERFAEFWGRCDDLLRRLPPKPRRNEAETAAAAVLLAAGRGQRERFLRAHAATVYERLTGNRSHFVRVEHLVYEAAASFPGLVPTRERLALERDCLQRDKDGLEIDQGIFLAHVLAHEPAGLHLCHAMLLPLPESRSLLDKLARDGRIDLGPALVERRGQATHVTTRNPRHLNAEDNSTLEATEIAVDLAILDPATQIAVLRGGPIDNPKYAGRRVFGAGINLTHLYRGQIPFVWFLARDMGFVHKFLRGVARPDALPDDVRGQAVEKPWIAAVDAFAIGGHCQILLTMDYVLAAHDAYLTLPARKEGIIPGLANLRMPRFTGDRIARQAVQYERKIMCDSPEGLLLCDEIAPADEMDAALARIVDGLTSAGVVSAVANRRAFRIGEEPLDLFRRYCSAYARDQAYCHFSPALIANLERNWNAHNRKT